MSITNTSSLFDTDFTTQVALGNVPGFAIVNKFGRNPELDINGNIYQDVWEGRAGVGTDYPFFPASAQSMELVSASVNDAAAGTGAQSVLVEGLDGNYAEISETVVTNGTSVVALSNTYIAINRAFVVASGSLGFNEGLIDIQIAAGGDIGARIGRVDSSTGGTPGGKGMSQTAQAVYTVPANKQLVLKGAFINVNKAKDAVANLDYQMFGDTFRVIGVASVFENIAEMNPARGFVCEQKSVIKMSAATLNSNAFATAGFGGFLVDM